MEMLNINAFFQIWNTENSAAEFFPAIRSFAYETFQSNTYNFSLKTAPRTALTVVRGRVLMLEGPNA